MNVLSAIKAGKEYLKAREIVSNDALFIMSKILGISSNDLNMEQELNKKQYNNYIKCIKKRGKHIPLDCIVGYTEFLDNKIAFSRNVLTPRQETEILTDKIIRDINKTSPDVLDLCSGSGCIALAIARHTSANVYASDVSKKAIKEITKNAKLNNTKITIVRSNLFDNIYTKFDIIVCNPPYINKIDMSSLEVEVKKFDPKLALYGGIDGLNFYREIISNAPEFLNDHGKIYFEIGFDQGKKVAKLLEKDFEDIVVIKDYAKLDRFVIAKKRDIYAK